MYEHLDVTHDFHGIMIFHKIRITVYIKFMLIALTAIESWKILHAFILLQHSSDFSLGSVISKIFK